MRWMAIIIWTERLPTKERHRTTDSPLCLLLIPKQKHSKINGNDLIWRVPQIINSRPVLRAGPVVEPTHPINNLEISDFQSRTNAEIKAIFGNTLAQFAVVFFKALFSR